MWMAGLDQGQEGQRHEGISKKDEGQVVVDGFDQILGRWGVVDLWRRRVGKGRRKEIGERGGEEAFIPV
jgi:hypothetical protein